ncbi:hypothetical protein GALMADRAFT_135566 [Galerina marginata CBS 339.88]|uniref:Cytochrome P450 n=1 Tax=Galerina marginata (strain CBS 339.88) TaxID=685588 RepID=A0A067TT95_GALM3|nr:hypothetical protein GALMADRAFT_135566 [Galerina marginata CBS 339.88]
MPSYTSIAAALLLFWIVKRLFGPRSNSQQGSSFPPGPPPKPLIGNLTDLPTINAAQTYIEWQKKYNSEILYASALGGRRVVLNNREDAEEILDRRAGNYSDRPVFPIIKRMGWEYQLGFYQYGDKWRFNRKIFQQNFRPHAIQKYQPVQTQTVHAMLRSLLDSPEKFNDHNKLLSISVPMMTMYGYEVKSLEDPCVVAADKSIFLGLKLLAPGATFINFFPALAYIPSWFPGASSHKLADEVKRLTDKMEGIPMAFVKKSVAEGTATPSLVGDFLERKNHGGVTKEEEEAIKNTASTVYGAASDTTISATSTFFYVMAINPDVQRKAQAEIDHLTGSKRLPEFQDRPFLPYIEAIYREVMRFNPPLQVGLPHNASEDDYYKGYFIPKGILPAYLPDALFNLSTYSGTSVFANIWAMTHDERVYPEPLKFKPERFLDENGNLNDDDRVLAYGFGRRVCVGKHVASSTMWLIIASVLASFNISKAKDESGNDIEINDEYEDLSLIQHVFLCFLGGWLLISLYSSHKTKFQCSFTPRSTIVRQLIEDTAI